MFLAALFCFLSTACSSSDGDLSSVVYTSASAYGIITGEQEDSDHLFAGNLCVPEDGNLHTDEVDSQVASAAGVFNTSTLETVYAQNLFQQIYPASTTKILTALVAIEYGDLNQVITVSENAVNQASDSSVAHLAAGDQLTLEQLLYGMMLQSGNDAAIAIAEGCVLSPMSSSDDSSEQSGMDAFIERMNQEALRCGATHSHFVNPNGLHDDNHYTCAYDMYLIFNRAVSFEKFTDLIRCPSYYASYTNSSGQAVSQTWKTTNQYLTGFRRSPDGITVIGGKTGTTGQAGYCLVLYSQNAAGEKLISLVYNADCRSNLYLLMGEILSKYGVSDG